VSPATDVEIDRVLNAINVTMNDQPSTEVGPDRLQAIADGATGLERKLHVRTLTPNAFALDDAETHRHIATAERAEDDTWTVRREREAQGSHVAVPGKDAG
jgi:hypothetical protein